MQELTQQTKNHVEAASTPKVSVCCAWFNRPDFISDTLQSLLNQDYDDFEIIVVNDGSTDLRTMAILEEYSDSRLRIIHQENTGFVRAIKRAIQESSGQYIAIQGAGDVSLPRRLRAQADLLDERPEIDVVGCRLHNIVVGGATGGETQLAPAATMNPTLETFLSTSSPFTHGEVMMRRSTYDAVGGYRDFFEYAQDRDLWIRIAEYGAFTIVDELLYERRLFTTDGIITNLAKKLKQQALSAFARQCHHDRQNFGSDYVTVFGRDASLFRKSSTIFARYCARESIKAFASGERQSARALARIARQERVNLRTLVIEMAMILGSRIKIIGDMLASVLNRHPSSGIWKSSSYTLFPPTHTKKRQ